MKKSNKTPNMNCEDIERLLIKKNFDALTQNENLLVKEHLIYCQRCQIYQDTLSKLEISMQIGAEEKLTPNPIIRQNIIQRMKTYRPVETGIFAKSWHSIRSIFEYRIPVYQTLFGLVLIALIFLAVNLLSSSPDQELSEHQGLTQKETLIPAQMSVVDDLEIIKRQKIGQNVREDTTLIRFMFTTM